MPVLIRSVIVLLIIVAGTARANDWPRWRGPDLNGISKETGWLDQWPKEGPPVVWKANVGTGFSSVSVAQGRLFTMGNENNTDTVYCFDALTGKSIWKHSYKADLGDNSFDGGTAGTPTVDGDRVYTLSRWGNVLCFEAATGKIVWSRDVATEHDISAPSWGFSGSPLVHDDLLLLNLGEAGMALKKAGGETAWSSANKDSGYSTPLPMKRGGEWFALLASGQSYLAVHLKTGKEAWRVRWLTEYGVNAADPIVQGDNVFISSGYGKGAALLKLTDGEPEILWKKSVLRSQANSAVLLDGHLYGIDGNSTDRANFKCIEYMTGTEKWSAPGIGFGSVMAASGKLIVLGDRGELLVAKASPDGFKPSARAQVMGGKCWIVPVLANGRIYCRNARGDVVCVDVTSK